MIRNFFFIFFFIFVNTELYAATKISVVDIGFIIEKSNAGKKITAILKKNRETETNKLKTLQDKIKKKEDELKTKSNILSDSEKKKRIEDLNNEVKSYRTLKSKKENEFNSKKAELINNLLKEINKIMIDYIEKNSIDIVVKKENLVTAKKELDITKIILEELNKKKINFK